MVAIFATLGRGLGTGACLALAVALALANVSGGAHALDRGSLAHGAEYGVPAFDAGASPHSHDPRPHDPRQSEHGSAHDHPCRAVTSCAADGWACGEFLHIVAFSAHGIMYAPDPGHHPPGLRAKPPRRPPRTASS